ncbi:FG-GAP repeat domain-containing protein [Streptomyces sp. NPDC001978]|uniref:FG-GAP repeat domain-containing protein n=1 Tax=Streptomyces sp. NPDC001978 TaxID=3364627 RepID=UPI00369EF8ED
MHIRHPRRHGARHDRYGRTVPGPAGRKGTFTSRVRLFTDWGNSYNTVVGAGDITGDGKADIVARDTAGNLYRQTGYGNGSFASRVKIGTGWQGYKALY